MYPNLLPLIFFSVAAAFTPGPNNIVGSYSGFNFGIKKSLPLILGVTLGYTTLITLSAAGLNVVFNTYPILKTIIKIIGSLFLIYLAYKISFQNQVEEKKINGNKLGYIAMVYAISKPFSTFWDGCIKTTLPSFSIAPKIRTSEIIPAIFFLGKLQTPITCLPTKFCSL